MSKTSELTNDEDGSNPFITANDIPPIPENTSDLTNDSGFITSADLPTVGDGTIKITTRLTALRLAASPSTNQATPTLPCLLMLSLQRLAMVN